MYLIKKINRLRKEIKTLLSNGVNSLAKEINTLLRKRINRLPSKGMSNIYLKSYYWEKQTFSKFGFLSSKDFTPVQFLGAPTLADIIEF